MSTKYTIYSIILALLVGVAIGRYSLPSKIQITHDSHEVDNKVADKDTSKHDATITTITETKHKDGSITKITQIKDDVDTNIKTHVADVDTKDVHDSKIVTYNTMKWTVAGIALTKPLSGLHPTITYGGEVMYRVIGPIQVGILGTADGQAGIALGLTF